MFSHGEFHVGERYSDRETDDGGGGRRARPAADSAARTDDGAEDAAVDLGGTGADWGGPATTDTVGSGPATTDSVGSANVTPSVTAGGCTTAATSRRGFLSLGASVLAAASLGCLATRNARAAPSSQAPWVMPDPALGTLQVGGGETYERAVPRRAADAVVATKPELLGALRDARDGDIVYVDDGAVIDMQGADEVGIRDGVTLASGRGQGGSPGGLVYTDEYPDALFKVYGDGVRFTGLRIRGPRSEYFESDGSLTDASRGLWLLGDDGLVDNCQVYGWPYAAVSVGAQFTPASAHVHHNSLHNNQLQGLGYGVDLLDGHSLVEHNHFDHNRHAIDGFGYETNGYEARYNLVGPHTVSHGFDMHCLEENLPSLDVLASDDRDPPPGNRAGGTIDIHHNAFQFTHDVFGRPQEAITLRGVPGDRATIERNWFAHPDEPVAVDVSGAAYRQRNLDGDGWQRVHAADNAFGVDYVPSDLMNAVALCRLPATGLA